MYSIDTPVEEEYFNKFNCSILIDSCGYYTRLYQKKLL